MKTVARTMWIHEADLIKSKLELHGIRAFIPDEGMATANPLLGNAIGGIRVQVGDEDYDEAKEILAEVEEPVAEGDLVCPRCGSNKRIECENISKTAFFLSILLVGIPLLWLKGKCTCLECGASWKQD